MTAAVHASTRLTSQATNTTQSFTTELTLTASALTTAGFAVNDEVIVMYWAAISTDDAANHTQLQLTYNGAALGVSPVDQDFNAGNRELAHGWWTRVDLGATITDFDLDILSVDTPGTAALDLAEIVVIRLADFGTEGREWFHNKSETAEELDEDSPAYSNSDDGATITFTPINVEDWIVLSALQLGTGGTGLSHESRTNLDAGTIVAGEFLEEFEAADEEHRWSTFGQISALAASSHTVEIESRDDGTGTQSDHISSELLIFRKDVWADLYIDLAGTVAVANDTDVQVATITDTLSTAQDVVMLGNGNQISTEQQHILWMWIRQDGTTVIDPVSAKGSGPRNSRAYDLTDKKFEQILAIKNLSGTLDLDLFTHANGTVSLNMENTRFMAWGMELTRDVYPPFPRRQNTLVSM